MFFKRWVCAWVAATQGVLTLNKGTQFQITVSAGFHTEGFFLFAGLGNVIRVEGEIWLVKEALRDKGSIDGDYDNFGRIHRFALPMLSVQREIGGKRNQNATINSSRVYIKSLLYFCTTLLDHVANNCLAFTFYWHTGKDLMILLAIETLPWRSCAFFVPSAAESKVKNSIWMSDSLKINYW